MTSGPPPATASVVSPSGQRELPAQWLLFGLAAALGVGALLPPGPLKVLIAVFGSGLPPLLAVRRRWGLAELLVVAPPSALVLWTLLAAAAWGLASSPAAAVVPAGLACVLGGWARRRGRSVVLSFGRCDRIALAGVAVAVIAVAAVLIRNGAGADGFVARSWLAGDGFYFLSLAQEAIERGGYPDENPFVAGVRNAYPSLFHLGFAALALQHGPVAALAGAWIALPLLAASPGLLALVCCRSAERSAQGVGPALAFASGAVLLRPDLFVYLQAQPVATGMLLLTLWLWDHDQAPPLERLAACAVAVVVVFGHSISGAGALAFLGARALALLAAKSSRVAGGALLIGVAAVALGYLAWNSFDHPAEVGPFALARLAPLGPVLRPWLLPLAGLGVVAWASRAAVARTAAPVALALLGFAYLVHGSRLQRPFESWFIAFNAERFFHLALLLALPALPTVGPRLASVAAALVVTGALVVPTHLARQTPGLLFDAPTALSGRDLELFERIRLTTPARATFLTTRRDYALPAFSGRPQNPHEVNLWALHSIAPEAFARRLGDVEAFATASPAGRLVLLDERGYTHVLLAAGVGTRAQRASWVATAFPPESMEIAIDDDHAVVLARRDPRAARVR